MAALPDRLHMALDIGNTFTKVGLFRGMTLLDEPLRLGGDDWDRLGGIVTNHRPQKIIYSTVANVPPAAELDRWRSTGAEVTALSAGLPLPFTSLYRTMPTLGLDRLAGVAGATVLGPDATPSTVAIHPTVAPAGAPPYLIVDAGTCLTLDLLDADGVHHGGNISPGMEMRLAAMHERTARLPNPGVGTVAGKVGDGTDAALRHGALLGVVYEIEGLFARLAPQFPGLRLLLTGGDAEWLNRQLTPPRRYAPHLVLRGLIKILSSL